jgi:small subunit ribosomal protein S4
LFKEAKATNGPTGGNLLEMLERRLDNLVFRAGFAPTAAAARQLVRHRHVTPNGRSVNIPSIRVKPGDTITLTDNGSRIPATLECLQAPVLTRPEWISFDSSTRSATVTRLPGADEIPFPIEVQYVVEYYAVRL